MTERASVDEAQRRGEAPLDAPPPPSDAPAAADGAGAPDAHVGGAAGDSAAPGEGDDLGSDFVDVRLEVRARLRRPARPAPPARAPIPSRAYEAARLPVRAPAAATDAVRAAQTQVWGCPDCGGRRFLRMGGRRHCTACNANAMK